MTILNIECLICTELFTNSDDICSTDCGHIFHYHCWNSWQEKSTQCPQCRKETPTNHKIYLNCDISDENLFEQINELNIKLESSLDKINELNDEICASENNYLQLEGEYTKSQELMKKLEERINQLHDYENNFLQLEAEYTKSQELIKKLEERVNQLIEYEHNFLQLEGDYTKSQELIKKLEERINQVNDCENDFLHLSELYNNSEILTAELQDQIQCLTIEKESQSKELILKTMENEQLKIDLEINNEISGSILQDKTQIMEQRRKHLQAELEKEITKNVYLSIDNGKLQCYIDSMISATNSEKYKNGDINQSSCHKKHNRVELETSAECCSQSNHKEAHDKQHVDDKYDLVNVETSLKIKNV